MTLVCINQLEICLQGKDAYGQFKFDLSPDEIEPQWDCLNVADDHRLSAHGRMSERNTK